MVIHHRHVHVSSASSVPLLCDHPGRLETAGVHWLNHLAFLFPFHFSSPCAPFYLVSSYRLLSKTNPIPVFSFHQLYATWTLGALSSNPAPVLSERWNNSYRASTALSCSLQENCSAPHKALRLSTSNSIIQAACHCLTLSHSLCAPRKDASVFVFDCRPSGISTAAAQLKATAVTNHICACSCCARMLVHVSSFVCCLRSCGS